MQTADLIIVAAGKGLRFGSDKPKQFVALNEKPILARALEAFERHTNVQNIVIVGSVDWLFHIQRNIVEKYDFAKVAHVVEGGRRRQDSVELGLAKLDGDAEYVLVHDGARPFASYKLIDDVLVGCRDVEACIPALSLSDTIKEVEGEFITKTLDRSILKRVQTPQAFKKDALQKAFKFAHENNIEATDEAYIIEKMGGKTRWIAGDFENIKITTQFDLKIAKLIVEQHES